MLPPPTSYFVYGYCWWYTDQVALENTTSEFESFEREPENPDKEIMADSLQRDSVAIVRNIINNVRASQLRHDEFKEVIE